MQPTRFFRRNRAAWCVPVVGLLVLVMPGCKDDDDDDKNGGDLPQLDPGQLGVNPNQVKFGGVAVGSTEPARQKVIISNLGESNLIVSSIALTDTTHEDFGLVIAKEDRVLGPEESMEVEITFLPSSVGEREGMLSILSDDIDFPDSLIPITGQGVRNPDWEIPTGQCIDVTLAAASIGDAQYWITVPSDALLPANCQYLLIEVREQDPADSEISLSVNLDDPVTFDPDTGAPESTWSGSGAVLIGPGELAAGVYHVVAQNPGDVEVAFKLCADLIDSGVPYKRGDINGDGEITVDDVILLLSFLFQGGDKPGCVAAADTNADSRLTVSDGTFLLRYLFDSVTELPVPFEECGCDTVPNPFGCESFAPCAN